MSSLQAAFVPVLIVCLGMYIFVSAFYYEEVIAEPFTDLSPPTGFLSFLDFIKDLAVGIVTVLWNIFTVNVPDWPAWLRAPIATFCMLVMVGNVIIIFAGAL